MVNNWLNMDFAHPKLLWLLPVLLVIYIFWMVFRYKKQYGSLQFSQTKWWDKQNSFRANLLFILPLLRFLSLCFIVIALARPQDTSTDEKIKTLGIDLVLSMDVSSSMLAQDFKPNRLEAAKDVASVFIEKRPSDRIGLVIFGGESFTQVPITTDHKIVQSQLAKIEQGKLVDGTAIGMGIGTAINRLKDSEAKSKVIILMTDGVNNTGTIDPMIATEAALPFDVKIYTIGIGSKGQALTPAYYDQKGNIQYDYMTVEIDEDLLTTIAEMTGGKYYRATDKESLEYIYAEIDLLEKTEIESSQTINVEELFYPFAALAIALLFFELFLKYSLLRVFS